LHNNPAGADWWDLDIVAKVTGNHSAETLARKSVYGFSVRLTASLLIVSNKWLEELMTLLTIQSIKNAWKKLGSIDQFDMVGLVILR
jgi:hypothetical protein